MRIILGLVLLSAAAFKAYALWTGAETGLSLFASQRWQVALIEVETLLGLWLLTGLYARGAWLAALVAFGLFGAASLYLAIMGQPSCACFGSVDINPRYTFVFDLFAFVGLVVWRPASIQEKRSLAWLGGGLQVGLGAAAFLSLIAVNFRMNSKIPFASLEGTWEVISVVRDGIPDPLQQGSRLRFLGDEVTFYPTGKFVEPFS